MDVMKQKAIDDYMTYATAVIKSRAIPLAEDGFKPVIRRILYTMNEMKIGSNSKTVKSSKVVGEVMGNYHPHGDASIYDALVRLSQDWKMRYPLTEIHGNNGSLNGDGPAAARYTECRLSAAGEAMLEGLDKDIVTFVPNYDNTTTEPTMLSGIFPNLLCNGTEGIAVGISCSLVPHNLNNVIDLIVAHINNPAISIKEAVNIIKGPDFPLGGIVVDGYKLQEIYSTGKGTITLRAKAEIDEKNHSIIFSEFPYLVDVQDRIIKAIQKMVLDNGYSDITECENHIGKSSCYIKIICQRNANLRKVLNDLYEQTPLEKTVKINNTVIYNGVPMTMSLLGLTNVYINHRHHCIVKLATKELKKQTHIAHIQGGLLAATTKIDEVVALIRSSNNKEEARVKLKSLLGIDSEQADAILALQLGRLTKLDVNDINIKIQKAEHEIEVQNEIIKSREKQNEIIIQDLEKLRKKFGDKRRTEIITDEPKEEKQEQEYKEFVVVGNDGNIYHSGNIDDFKKGGIMGKATPEKVVYNDGLPVYVCHEDGTVGEEWESSASNLFKFNGEKQYLITISKKGIGKKTPIGEYKKLSRLCKVKDGDSLGFVLCANEDENIILHLNDNKVVKIAVADIKTSGKLTIGVKITNSNVLNAFVASEFFYTINDKMQIKKVETKELTRSTVSLNSGCVSIGSCLPHTVYYSRGKLTEIDWSKVSIKSRLSEGAKISNSEIKVY